jgi:hypothetical protein
MSLLPTRKVLDLDFSFIDDLPVEDRFPALIEFSQYNQASWIEIAALVDAADNAILHEKVLPSSVDPTARRELFWETIVPDFIKKDRRRASDYRNALRILRQYGDDLDRAGFDPYAAGSFTNILRLPRAITNKSYCPEVFEAAAGMDTRAFLAYSNGVSLPLETSPTLKEYLHALNRRYNEPKF